MSESDYYKYTLVAPPCRGVLAGINLAFIVHNLREIILGLIAAVFESNIIIIEYYISVKNYT